MGTYRQPSQIIDKSLNTLNQGLQSVQQTMTAELNRRREIELKKAEEAEKKFKAFESSRDTKVDEYKYAMSDWKTINQGEDPNWEAENVSIENQLKNNALYYLDVMSGSVEGDERYRNAELSIKNMIRDYPVMAELLNSEAQEYNKTIENPDLLIETDDPLAGTKQSMLSDIYNGKNPYRFNVQAGPQGLSIKYKDEDGNDFNLKAQDYEKHVSNGYNLIDTTNTDAYNEFMEGVSGVVFQNYNDNVTAEQISTFKDDLKTGKTTTTTDVIENFERANAQVKKQINAYVEKGAPITQNEWQLLGGTGVYRGTNDQKSDLKIKLYDQQIAMNGVPDSDLTVLRKRTTKESRTPVKNSSDKKDETISLSKINLSDVEDIITDTRKQVADYRKTEKPNPVEELKIRETQSKKIEDILIDEFKNKVLKFGDETIEIDSFEVESDSNGNFIIQPIEIGGRKKLEEAGVSYIIKDFDDLNQLKEHLLAGNKNLSRVLETEKENKKDPLNLGI